MTQNELYLLLYLESCAVDYGGTIESDRITECDADILDTWNESRFVRSGRLASESRSMFTGLRKPSLWVELSEEAWQAAHAARRARAERLLATRTWVKTEELHEV